MSSINSSFIFKKTFKINENGYINKEHSNILISPFLKVHPKVFG